jgi:hypothetical protein
MKLEFSWQIFEKYFSIKFHEIHPVEAELFHVDGQMDSHDKANSHFSQFWKFAWKLLEFYCHTIILSQFHRDVTEGSTWWTAVRTNYILHRAQLLTVISSAYHLPTKKLSFNTVQLWTKLRNVCPKNVICTTYSETYFSSVPQTRIILYRS